MSTSISQYSVPSVFGLRHARLRPARSPAPYPCDHCFPRFLIRRIDSRRGIGDTSRVTSRSYPRPPRLDPPRLDPARLNSTDSTRLGSAFQFDSVRLTPSRSPSHCPPFSSHPLGLILVSNQPLSWFHISIVSPCGRGRARRRDRYLSPRDVDVGVLRPVPARRGALVVFRFPHVHAYRLSHGTATPSSSSSPAPALIVITRLRRIVCAKCPRRAPPSRRADVPPISVVCSVLCSVSFAVSVEFGSVIESPTPPLTSL